MSKTSKLALLVAFILAGETAEGESVKPLSNSGSPTGPRIQFENPIFDFGKMKSGDPARHTFFFTNSGDSLLVISNVQTQCGCTTAGEWTRRVEPGGSGSIPVQFNTLNYGGQVLKTVTVSCNDPKQASITLQMKGTVWKPIDVQPTFAIVNIPADATNSVSTTVRILNNMDELLILSDPKACNKMFTTQLKTNVAGRDFSLVISAVPPFEQLKSQCAIKMKSSSSNLPPISVWANLQKASVSQTNLVFVPGPK
jgi:hypothetical protein